MGRDSGIEWTHHTFNPWLGCTKISPGCKHCYAERQTRRMPADRRPEWGPHPRIRTAGSTWRQPLAWDRAALRAGERHRVFVASLADVFDPTAPQAWRDDLWHQVGLCQSLDWLLLTKRIEHAADMVPAHWLTDWPAHVWLGISVCTQSEADRDIPRLLRLPAPVRFLSCEPLLGPVNLMPWLAHCHRSRDGQCTWQHCPQISANAATDSTCCLDRPIGLHWVIAGGESGPHARPSHPDWFRDLRDQCTAAGVPFLFKQWGEWAPEDLYTDRSGPSLYWCAQHAGRWFAGGDGLGPAELDAADWMVRLGKARAGRVLDGRTWDEVPRP
jgi:protein gp37